MSSSSAYQSVLDYINDTKRRFVASGAYHLLDSVITGGAIYDARVDMNKRRIRNVGTPIDNGDAVPYGLFTSVTAEFEPFILTGTAQTTYANSPDYGTFFINIRSQQDGGPTGCWCLSRSSVSSTSYSKVLVSSATANEEDGNGIVKTTLDLSWPPNSPITICKSSVRFDGVYEIKLSR